MTGVETSFEYLKKRYGVLMTLDEVAEVFRYKSAASARKAHSRGHFPVKLYRFENKSGYYARVEEVIDCLNNMQAS